MKTGELFAVLGVASALGAGIGTVIETSSQANTRSQAIQAQTCEGWDKSVTNYGMEISQETINCLKEGWIPNARTINTTGFSVGESQSILTGYVAQERSSSEHFDATSTLGWSIGGLMGGLGLVILEDLAAEEAKAKAKAKPKKLDETDPGKS